ncbi:hypothetical protein GCM10023091_20270 [Ravibacter arvi]|uniref:Ig-like domain-containing protein n=1 Tax=Ravibacter arvi TaxID=2051041 RepID=A0ABP8LZQ8_9BACT
MKLRLFTPFLAILFAGLLSFTQAFAQISNVTYAANACAGQQVTVTFNTTITSAGRSFAIALVPAAGSPIPLGTTTSTTANVTIPASTAPAANYKISVTSVTPPATATGAANISIASIPAPPTAAALADVCAGTTVTPATISGAVSGGSGLKWFTSADLTGAGTASPVVNNPLAVGTHQFYVASTNASCKSAAVVVSIKVNAVPAAPGVSNINACVGQTVTAADVIATVSNPEAGTLTWYATAAATTGTSSPAAPNTSAAATIDYFVSVTKNGCEGPKANLKVIVAAPPATPVLSAAPAPVCVNEVVPSSTFTSAVAAGPGSLVWYATNTSTTPLTGSAITVNTSTAGTKRLFVARKSGSCESSRLEVTLEVKAAPAAPGVSPLTVCVGTSPNPVLTATGTGLKWYTSADVLLSSAPTIATTTAGTFTYKVSQTVGGCESPKATITATVKKTPPPVTDDVAYCKGETPAALTATGTALKWYTSSTGGTGSATAPTVSTATVGTVAYYVTQTVDGCESDRARIDVKTKAVPVAPTVANMDDVCRNTTLTSAQLLSKVTAATGTLKWYTVATGGTGTATAPAPVTTTAGPVNFYVSQSVDGCESPRANIKLEVRESPVAPTVIAAVDLCHQAPSTEKLTATPTGTNTLKWYSVASGGTALPDAPVPSTATVTTTPLSYYVSQSQKYSATLTCEGPRATINVAINPLPAVANTTDQALCQTRGDETANFLATPTAGTNSLLWYPNASSTTGETVVPKQALKTPGEFQYYVAQKSAKQCLGAKKLVKIRVKRLPVSPSVANLEYCQFENAPALTAGLEPSATINWYGRNATGGTPSPTAPKPSTEEGGNYSYYVSQTLEGCEGDRSELKVLIKTTPKPQTQDFITYCHNAAATPLSATGQRLAWYRPNGEKRSEAYTPFTATVGDQYFYVTQTGDNNCESPKQEIKITVYPLPSATISGQSSIPLGASATIKIVFTGMGPWNYKLSNGYSNVSESNTVEIQVQPSVTTSYLVTEVSNACGKGTPNGNAVVTVLVPTITTGNPDVVAVCAGTEVSVPFQQSGNFPANSRFVLQLSRENKGNTFKSVPSAVSGNSIKATLPDTLAGGNYYIRVISENTNPNLNVEGSVSGVNLDVAPRPTAILPEDRAIYAGQSTSISIGLTGEAPWTFTYSDGTTKTPVTTSTTPYVFTATPAATATYTVTEIANKCGAGRSVGSTRVQVDPILGVEPSGQNWVKVMPTLIESRCKVSLDVTDYNGIDLKIVDMSGREVRRMSLSGEVTDVDMNQLPSGIYFFRVGNSRQNAVIKVLKH